MASGDKAGLVVIRYTQIVVVAPDLGGDKLCKVFEDIYRKTERREYSSDRSATALPWFYWTVELKNAYGCVHKWLYLLTIQS